LKRGEIDVKSILKQAQQEGVSVQLIMKRQSNYRKAGKKEILYRQMCEFCAYTTPVKYNGCPKRKQCYWIGVANDHYADVSDDHVCDNWKKGYKR
jgi:hypothetical protein